MNRATWRIEIVLVVTALCNPTSTFSGPFQSVRHRIHKYVHEEGIPSIAAAAVRESEIVWLESSGWADVENRVAATAHTPYMLASASKPISATALMIAVEKGLLKLDAPVNGYLGESPFQTRLGDASKITVRDLLLHRSGIPNYTDAFFHDERYRPPGIEGLLHHYGFTMMPHGEFHYSNLAFSSMAVAITNTTRQSFSSFVQREVFDPLGMNDSIVPEPGTQPEGAAVRYGEKGRLRPFSTTTTPAAEIYASVIDLARFATLHLKNLSSPAQRKILSDASIDEMQTCTIPIRFFHYKYGLGWSVGHDPDGRKHVFHGGGFAGCDAFVTLLPEKNVGAVCLSNKSRKWPGIAVSQDIVERTLGTLIDDKPEDVRINYSRLNPAAHNSLEKIEGEWSGKVIVGNHAVSVVLRIGSSAYVKLDDGTEEKVENAEFVEDAFFGVTKGALRPTKTHRLPELERLMWDLRVANNHMRGVLYLNCPSDGNGYLLPH